MQTNIEFKTFIISLLKKSNITQDLIEKITNEEGMKQFEISFTHKSFNPDENYELIELIGDSIVNACIIKYIRIWDPKIISVKILTRLHHNLRSKDTFYKFAEKCNFFKFIKLDEELKNKYESMTNTYRASNSDYKSLLEDTFEAFIGTVDKLLDEIEFGKGNLICYQIIKSFLDEIKISLDYKDIFDAKTRFKEVCDNQKWIGPQLPLNKLIITNERYDPLFDSEGKPIMGDDGKQRCKKMFVSNVYGYPFGDKSPKKENQTSLATATSNIKMNAENDATELAIKMLEKKYKIFLIPADPYKRIN